MEENQTYVPRRKKQVFNIPAVKLEQDIEKMIMDNLEMKVEQELNGDKDYEFKEEQDDFEMKEERDCDSDHGSVCSSQNSIGFNAKDESCSNKYANAGEKIGNQLVNGSKNGTRFKKAKVKRKSKGRQITEKPKRMSRKGCTRFNYSEQNMNLAVEAMKAGSSAKAAARQYGVPRTTLTDKFKGKSPRSRRMGPSPVLTDIEELEVVQWIMNMNSAGFPVTRNLIVETVSKLIIELGRPNTFKDNVPGRSWFNSFTRRHPSLNQVITRNTGDLTTEKLIQWRQQLSTYLEKHNLLHVIRQPTRVFNSREAAFCLCPSKSTQMVVRRNFKYTSNLNEEKDYLTIQLTGNADGMLAPPLLIVPYERMPLAMGRSIPGSWMIGKASSGWKTSEIFLDYISNGFLPWLQKKQIELPVILFVDGHASHSSMALGKFCKEHGIYLISLSPNYADIVQPMDVAVFKTLRTTWKKALTRWKSEHGRTFKRTDFAALIDSVIKDTVTPDILQSGFEKCGIVPWNVDNVDFTQCPDLVKNVSSATLSSQLVNFLEEFIYPETVSLFEEYEHSDDWQTGLAVEDYSLFELWRKLKSKVKRNEENISFSEEEEEEDEDGGEDNSSDYD